MDGRFFVLRKITCQFFLKPLSLSMLKLACENNHVDSGIEQFKAAWVYADFPMKIRPWLMKGLG